MADLTTRLAGLTLPNPVMTASGCLAPGRELEALVDVATLGAVVTRTVTLDPRTGTAPPRLVESPSGWLNAVGLPGPGAQTFLATELTWFARRQARTIVSIAGATLGEYADLARRVGTSPGVSALEVNLSVPDVSQHGLYAAADPYHAAKVVAAVRRDIPQGVAVIAKLPPEVSRVVDLARAVAESGADAVTLVNAAPALAIDPATLRPSLGGALGGLSGPALRPIALRCVWQVHQALPDLPVIGAGGISSGEDAVAFLAAGATAVQVGSALLHDPTCAARTLQELDEALGRHGFDSASAAVGVAHLTPSGDPR